MKLIKQYQLPLILLIIYFIGLFLRLFRLEATYIYPDEITWMVRGKEFVYALFYRNLEYFRFAWWTDRTQVEAIGLPLSFLSGLFHIFFAGQGKFSLHLLPDIVASRLPIVLLNSSLPPLIYFFAAHFTRRRVALLASLLYLLNPLSIGLDRLLLHDSFLTLFSFAAIAFYFLALSKKKFSLLPGIFLGLAFLTKPNGSLVLIAWLVSFLLSPSKRSWKLLLLNLFSSAIIITLLWPASWFTPILAPIEYLFRQQRLVSAGVVTSFYLGQASLNPHWSYYLFQLFARLPLVILLGLLIQLLAFKTYTNKRLWLPIAFYVLVFFYLVSTSPQKLGFRYLLPLLPWITITAARAWVLVIDTLKLKYLPVLLLLITPLILIFFSYFPHLYLYYNPLVGGPSGAEDLDLVNLCLGSQPALEYLNTQTINGPIFIAGCQDTAPYYTNLSLTKNIQEAKFVILESTFPRQFPTSPYLSEISQFTLIKKFYFRDLLISSLYQRI